MAFYFVTGKLGSGKTLCAVGKIRDYLLSGKKVATNIDINLTAMFGIKAKNINLVRLPDKPDVSDFESLGYGNLTKDESLNGLIVLDECGTWFNSRSWADKSRQFLVNWILHARKFGWDVIVLVQNINIVDKQLRLSTAEFVVHCRRMDRLRVPFIHGILKLITLGFFSLPKLHLAIVKYGDAINSPVVDTWKYHGFTLYSSYDTKQIFNDNYPHGSYCVLPPFYKRRAPAKINLGFFMRLTSIYLKRSKRFSLIIIGILLTITFQFFYNKYFLSKEISSPADSGFSSIYIDSYTKHGNNTSYIFSTPNGLVKDSDFIKSGVVINPNSSCSVNFIVNGASYEITCK